MDLDYEVEKFDDSSNMYKLKMKGEYENTYYDDISSASSLERLVREVVGKKYREQNNLEN